MKPEIRRASSPLPLLSLVLLVSGIFPSPPARAELSVFDVSAAARAEFGDHPWADDSAPGPDRTAVSESAPDSETPAIKVLGRGLSDRKTGATLQIACIGDPEEKGGERTCSQIQFLYVNESGILRLIGPVMELTDGDAVTRRAIRKALRDHRLAPKKLPGSQKFQVSKAIYLGKSTPGIDNEAGPLAPMIIVPTLYGIGRACPAIWFNSGIALSGAAGFLWTLPFLAIPVVIDLALLPFQVHRARAEFGALFGDLGKRVTVKSLRDRAIPYWQLRPRRVSHKGFEGFVDAIHRAGS